MKTRYRTYKPLFGKEVLVLQIGIDSKLGEWDGWDPYDCGAPPNWNPDEIVVSWRDAKTEDLIDIIKGEINAQRYDYGCCQYNEGRIT